MSQTAPPPSDIRPSNAPKKEVEANPLDRQLAFVAQRHAVLRDPEAGEPVASSAVAADLDFGPPPAAEESSTPVATPVPTLPPDFQQRVMGSYRERQRQGGADAAVGEGPPGAVFDAALPGPANNWVALGPSVLRQGQAVTRPAMSGRVAGVAVAPGGTRVYVASANGGVWRSDDAGRSWRSTMDAWDLNPLTRSSDSLSCGAIAIDQNNPDRVYVGTGEGGANSYYGVGPIRSDDGGENWFTEETSTPATSLAGSAFYALAVDPADRERVVGATERGLYRREPAGGAGGRHHWVRKAEGIYTSVVVARSGGVTTFYAAKQGGDVVKSDDGDTWTRAGTHFPNSDTYRIALAVQPRNPNVVYALVSKPLPSFHLRGVWRLDRGPDRWRAVTGAPADIFGDDPNSQGQGWYDIAIALDPNNINRLYLGGSAKNFGDIYPSSLYSCIVSTSGAGSGLSYRMATQYIGANVHADVHALEFAPGDSNNLWVGCDGGLFQTRNATGAATFESRNVGLATLTMNYLSQHPTEEAVIFCGTQDNGTSRFTGEEAWLHSCWGDGGYAVINWRDPRQILRTYTFGIMQRATDGGQGYDSWGEASLPQPHATRSEFYAPLVGTRHNPSAPAEADIVAFGGVRLWLSNDFGVNWASLPTDDTGVEDAASADALPQPDPQRLTNRFLSVVFASARRIYAGTTIGHVYRYDRQGAQWRRTAIHAAPLLQGGPVTRIAVDPADASGKSIYVTLGGHGDYRHLWHFDGQQWRARSGPADDPNRRLLDVQHNAVVVDPARPANLYIGADVGVWRSTDGGQSWSTFSFGLPDAAVLDLKIHEPRRLLRAATHGRGVFEYKLDTDTAPVVELYVRDTQLDVGRRASVAGLPDPTSATGAAVAFGRSPDIKVDAPAPGGAYQTPTNQINFYQFVDSIEDRSDRVATAAAGSVVNNRVYVLVHNRGVTRSGEAQVMLLLAAEVAGGIPDLPANFAAEVRQSHPINTPRWRTLGLQKLDGLQAGSPKVAAFDLPSSVLPPPGQLPGSAAHYLLAVLHAAGDEFTNAQTSVSALVRDERKATVHKLSVVPFGSEPPEGETVEGVSGGGDSLAEVTVAAEKLSLEVWGKRGAGRERMIYVRLTDEAGNVLGADEVEEVTVLVSGKGGKSQRLEPLKYHRGWRSFWLRVESLPEITSGVSKLTARARARERTVRKTQKVKF